VRATASNPSSMLNRSTSKKFPAVKKFSAMRENTAISARSATMSADVAAGRMRTRAGLRAACGNTCIFPRMCANGINDDRRQNDSALNRSFPIRTDAQKGQSRTDRSQQHDTKHRTGDRSDASGDRRSANHNRSDNLHFETDTGVAGNLIKPYG